MRVIGQFNLGFMIAELHGDLFLLDQHACDEKYRWPTCHYFLVFAKYFPLEFSIRFETLQLTTIIHRQKLLCPIYLHASPNYELIISENIDIFEAAGFGIDVIPDGDPGSRVRLTALPYSKSTQFDHNDVLELASLLSDADDTGLASTLLLKNSENTSQSRVKSPKLMAMFASRACRSAVMIGTALNATQMKNIINNLATIDQPWNCPHGRPTMRHLEDLNSVRLRREMLLDESC